MKAAEYRAMFAKPKGSKYGNVRTVYNGVLCDSKAEAKYAKQLDWRLKAGEVRNIEFQKPFKMIVNGEPICTYIADFVFFDIKESRSRVVDVKGVETRDFKIKKKLCKAIHNIEIECVKVK